MHQLQILKHGFLNHESLISASNLFKTRRIELMTILQIIYRDLKHFKYKKMNGDYEQRCFYPHISLSRAPLFTACHRIVLIRSSH